MRLSTSNVSEVLVAARRKKICRKTLQRKQGALTQRTGRATDHGQLSNDLANVLVDDQKLF